MPTYHPPVAKGMTPGEFAVELAECLFAVFLLTQTSLTGFVPKVGLIAVVGLVGSLWTNISY